MSIKISPEEFVKRTKLNINYTESWWNMIVENNMVLLDSSLWNKLKDILEDIVWLYKEYGLADDSMLAKDAQYLKERILEVKDDFKLEELKRLVEVKK